MILTANLASHCMRPPCAGRLQILDPEHVAFDLKSVCSDGTYQILLSPQELLEKLAALGVPYALNSASGTEIGLSDR